MILHHKPVHFLLFCKRGGTRMPCRIPSLKWDFLYFWINHVLFWHFLTAVFCYGTTPPCPPDQDQSCERNCLSPHSYFCLFIYLFIFCLNNRDFGWSPLHTDALPQTVMSSCLQPDSGRQRLLHPLTQGGQLAVGRTCPVALPGEDQEGWGPGPDLHSAQALLMEWRLGCPYGNLRVESGALEVGIRSRRAVCR